jgi:hypothetical protein
MSAATLSLLMLPVEIIYAIFKRLDRPSQLSLGLTGPHLLRLFASYYDLDRYRNDEKGWKKIGLSAGVSWDDSAAQPTIIRWLALAGCGDIDSPPAPPPEEEEEEEEQDLTGGFADAFGLDLDDRLADLPPPHEGSDEAREDKMVESIISNWLRAKFGIHGGCVICAECSRYMLVLGPNGKMAPWSKKMLSRPA